MIFRHFGHNNDCIKAMDDDGDNLGTGLSKKMKTHDSSSAGQFERNDDVIAC